MYKEKALKNSQIRTELGIPLKKKRTTHTYSVPSITKVIPQPPKVTTTTQENLEPAMDTETYHQILDTIQRIGRSLEQYPETVRNQNEECIRALFLAQLNATFTSLATTGESFNHNGKTDNKDNSHHDHKDQRGYLLLLGFLTFTKLLFGQCSSILLLAEFFLTGCAHRIISSQSSDWFIISPK